MGERVGEWMQTASGRRFWPMDPRESEVDLTDIAHALSLLCRYGGHTRFFYSVGQHSCHVSDACLVSGGRELALAGLLHDASEAYLSDVIRPIKPYLQGYYEAEKRLIQVIFGAFGLRTELLDAVKVYDNSIMANEYRDCLHPCEEEWVKWRPLPDLTIESWSPVRAEAEFLTRYVRLTR